MVKLRHVVPAAGIALELVAAVTLAFTLPDAQPASVDGTVRCASGAPIQGIWIEGFSGGSGFAGLSPGDRRSALVTYRYELPSGGKYQVHVGCGGTPVTWTLELRSRYVNPGTNHFLCHDNAARSDDRTCAVTSP